MSAASAELFAFAPRREPALLRSFILAAVMHAVLIAIMFLGVRFQSSAPDVVTVELTLTFIGSATERDLVVPFSFGGAR